ncbi:hypothetical protein N0V85_007614 [Neurospora sp. IMI 360204]|nr:hypothetical protein N0V85_007614 [Neurospora sp. IMI 360204]
MIQPISCDISKQDPVKNPQAGLKTTVLDVPLKQSSSKPTETGKPAASGDKSAGSTKPVESGKPDDDDDDNDDDDDDGDPDQKGGGSGILIAGVVAGVAVFIIGGLITLYLCILNRRKRKVPGAGAGHGHYGHDEKPRLNRSTSSFGNIISNPIVAEDVIRTDFNRSVSAQSHHRPTSDFGAVAGNVNPFDTPPRGSPPNYHSRNNSRAKTPSEGHDNSIAYGGHGRNVSGNVPGPSAYTGTGTSSRNNSPPPAAGGRSGYTTPPITPWGATSGGGGHGGGLDSPRGNSGVSINVFADPRTLTPERLANSNSNSNANYTYSKFINTNTNYPYLNNTNDYDPFNPENHDPHHNQTQTRPVTTFTAMMEEADLGAVARGAKYVPPTPKTPAGLLGPSVPGAGSMPNRF